MTSVSITFLFFHASSPESFPLHSFSQSSNWAVSFIWMVRGFLEQVLPFNSDSSSSPVLVGNTRAVHFLLILITFVLMFKFRNVGVSGRSNSAAKAKNWIFKHVCFSVPVVADRVLEQSPWVHLMQCSCSFRELNPPLCGCCFEPAVTALSQIKSALLATQVIKLFSPSSNHEINCHD